MGKKVIFYLVMVAIMLAILEVFALVAVQFVDRDDYFDHRERVYARLNDANLAKFRQKGGDPVLGWRSYGPRVQPDTNCQGRRIEYHYDAAGARLYRGFDPQASEIIIVGDSYTNGDEVEDDQTYPARLADLLRVSVANHGVGGYGPLQSMLNLEQHISRYPRARIVVLGIMYENLYRLLNSYRPVLYSTSSDFTLKPYMEAGRIVPHPGSTALADLQHFMPEAERAFDTDFWAKPKLEFPYLVSLAKGLKSHYFLYRKLQKQFRNLGEPEYSLIFKSDAIRVNLVGLLNRYAQIAREAGLQPVAIFIPRNRYDTVSATRFIEDNRAEIDAGLLLGDVGQSAGVDWMKFNLQEADGDDICHPSPYGYQAIADYIATFMRSGNAWPAH